MDIAFLETVIPVVSIFLGAPLIVFSFIYFTKKSKNEVEMMRYRKEILDLEVKKEELRLYTLHEENKKLDQALNREFSQLK